MECDYKKVNIKPFEKEMVIGKIPTYDNNVQESDYQNNKGKEKHEKKHKKRNY